MQKMRDARIPLFLAFLAACLLAGPPPAVAADVPASGPDPSLRPQEVVVIVMDALSRNDEPIADHGIAVTYAFASPANKAQTGPLARFAAMVKGPVYGHMVGHRGAVLENLEVDGDAARVDVILEGKDGAQHGYRFLLTRQHSNSFEGSWMTEAVYPIEVVTL